MAEELLINVNDFETRVALLVGGTVQVGFSTRYSIFARNTGVLR